MSTVEIEFDKKREHHFIKITQSEKYTRMNPFEFKSIVVYSKNKTEELIKNIKKHQAQTFIGGCLVCTIPFSICEFNLDAEDKIELLFPKEISFVFMSQLCKYHEINIIVNMDPSDETYKEILKMSCTVNAYENFSRNQLLLKDGTTILHGDQAQIYVDRIVEWTQKINYESSIIDFTYDRNHHGSPNVVGIYVSGKCDDIRVECSKIIPHRENLCKIDEMYIQKTKKNEFVYIPFYFPNILRGHQSSFPKIDLETIDSIMQLRLKPSLDEKYENIQCHVLVRDICRYMSGMGGCVIYE